MPLLDAAVDYARLLVIERSLPFHRLIFRRGLGRQLHTPRNEAPQVPDARPTPGPAVEPEEFPQPSCDPPRPPGPTRLVDDATVPA